MTEFTITARAVEFAKLWGVEDLVAAVIADMKRDGADVKRPQNLMFHTTFIGPMDDNKAFVTTPSPDNKRFVIDVAVFESHGELDAGPWKGFDVQMPSGVTPEDET